MMGWYKEYQKYVIREEMYQQAKKAREQRLEEQREHDKATAHYHTQHINTDAYKIVFWVVAIITFLVWLF